MRFSVFLIHLKVHISAFRRSKMMKFIFLLSLRKTFITKNSKIKIRLFVQKRYFCHILAKIYENLKIDFKIIFVFQITFFAFVNDYLRKKIFSSYSFTVLLHLAKNCFILILKIKIRF